MLLRHRKPTTLLSERRVGVEAVRQILHNAPEKKRTRPRQRHQTPQLGLVKNALRLAEKRIKLI